MDPTASTPPTSPPILSAPMTPQLPPNSRRSLLREHRVSGGIFCRSENLDTWHFRRISAEQPRTSSSIGLTAVVFSRNEALMAPDTIKEETRSRTLERREDDARVLEAFPTPVAASHCIDTGAGVEDDLIEVNVAVEQCLIKPVQEYISLQSTPVPAHRRGHHTIARNKDIQDPPEDVSIYSDDSMSDVSFTTAQLEQDWEDEARYGSSLTSKLGRAEQYMKAVAHKVGGRIRSSFRKHKLTKNLLKLPGVQPNMMDTDDKKNAGAIESSTSPSPTKADLTSLTCNNATQHARLGSLPPLLSLPVQPPNTPATPTTPLTFARHSIPTVPDWDSSPTLVRSRRDGSVVGTPERCNPLRTHANLMVFMDGPADDESPEGTPSGVEALEDRLEEAKERRTANGVFFAKRG